MTESTLLYQWVSGAYSHLSAENISKELIWTKTKEIRWCESFDQIRDLIDEWHIWILPIENSYAGTIHRNIYNFLIHDYKIIWTHTQDIDHCLLSITGKLDDIKQSYSHPQALAQTYQYCKTNNIEQIQWIDTADAARMVAESNDLTLSAIASSKAAEIYGLHIADSSIQDQSWNQTRFLIITQKDSPVTYKKTVWTTALLFHVRNVPWVLYKCLWAFATNWIDLTKIESLPSQKDPFTYMFWVECSAHLNDDRMKWALEELEFFTTEVRVLGEY